MQNDDAEICRSVRGGPDLRSFSFNPVKDSLVCGITETALDSGLFILLISLAEPLGPEIESIPEGFVDALKRLALGHEDLEEQQRVSMAAFQNSVRQDDVHLPSQTPSSMLADGSRRRWVYSTSSRTRMVGMADRLVGKLCSKPCYGRMQSDPKQYDRFLVVNQELLRLFTVRWFWPGKNSGGGNRPFNPARANEDEDRACISSCAD